MQLIMKRGIVLLMIIGLCCAFVFANDSLPVIEVKADRVMIYPQRMDLTGEESLMDVLQMMPELMISGFEDVIGTYNLRIDNCPINADERLVLTQMKAKDIAKIHVCTNTGVAKGSIGIGKVLDINMAMPDTVKGFVEAQGGFGKQLEGNGTVNVLYGSERTDIYANAAYRYQRGHEEYVSFHMTNRFDHRNRLLTYLTQQYLAIPDGHSQRIMGRARYFHTFNDAGTELLIVGGYHYDDNPIYSSHLPLFVVELNTPLPAKGLSLMAGVEGDYQITRNRDSNQRWNVFNHDIYLQLDYSLPHWRFTAGHRVMFFNYRMTDPAEEQKYFDVRNNTSVSIVYKPNANHNIQFGYYRKFYNPAYLTMAILVDTLLDERDINQLKVAYSYSRQKLTVQTEASYYFVEGDENFADLGASAYWHMKWLSLTGGANLYIARSKVYASLRLTPTFYLPLRWQIGLQLIYFTPKSPVRIAYGTPVYGSLSVNKQLGKSWNLGVEWHDMFDSFCSAAKFNRHAANIKVQYRF